MHKNRIYFLKEKHLVVLYLQYGRRKTYISCFKKLVTQKLRRKSSTNPCYTTPAFNATLSLKIIATHVQSAQANLRVEPQFCNETCCCCFANLKLLFFDVLLCSRRRRARRVKFPNFAEEGTEEIMTKRLDSELSPEQNNHQNVKIPSVKNLSGDCPLSTSTSSYEL